MGDYMVDSRCKVCNSPYRFEIEDLVLNKGMSYNAVVNYINDKYGTNFNSTNIGNHIRRHTDKLMVNIKEKYRSNVFNELHDMYIKLGNLINDAIERGDVKDITNLVREWRMLADKMDDMVGKYGGLVTPESLIGMFIRALSVIPYKYRLKVIDKLRSMEVVE